MIDLSPRQRQTLEWVREFIQDHGMPPTVREIGAAFGTKSSTVHQQLKAIQRKGYLARRDRSARSLILQRMTICPTCGGIGRIPRSDSRIPCYQCHGLYEAERRPSPNRRNFCPSCRERGIPVAYAKADLLERRREDILETLLIRPRQP